MMKFCKKRMFLFLLMSLWMVFSFTAYGKEYTAIEKGKELVAYPLSTGKLAVYEDSDRNTQIDSVSGKNLAVNLKQYTEDSFYGSYKKDGKTYYGWFREKDFIKDVSYEHKAAMARYKGKVYKRKGSSSWGNIPAYSAMEIIGKSGSWYQVTYAYGKTYRVGWLKKSTYNSIIRLYDGTEKRVMAEGIYTMSPASASSQAMTVSSSFVSLTQNKSSKKQQFEFQFTGQNCYKIISRQTGECLAAESKEGEYQKQVVLEEISEEQIPGQIWQLIRSGGYYYLKNKGTGMYLTAGNNFTTASKSSSKTKKFKLTITGGKNSNWQVFTQYDPEWGGKLYGKTNTMAGAACGVLSLTNAVYALNGQFIEPMKLAAYAVKTGCRVEGNGTDSSFFGVAAKKYGSDYGFKLSGSTKSLSVLKKHLKAGGTAIAYVPHHYMAVGDYKNGKYLALDSYATTTRKTTPYGTWVKGSRFKSGSLKTKVFFLFKSR
ncbi:MAG: RICIN domain-containing protein [Lachnospiraceae bacterium]|nr:RICIN domain-containing protein [Lachnospiraceae bacterium]